MYALFPKFWYYRYFKEQSQVPKKPFKGNKKI